MSDFTSFPKGLPFDLAKAALAAIHTKGDDATSESITATIVALLTAAVIILKSVVDDDAEVRLALTRDIGLVCDAVRKGPRLNTSNVGRA